MKDRIDTQQRRIGHGILNGSLTRTEAARLEARESLFVREVRETRAEHNGHLTAADAVRLNRQANRLSWRIFAQKHDEQFVGTQRSDFNWRENAQGNKPQNH